MKKLWKILAWTAGIVVALLIVAIVALKIFFPVEKVKAIAIERGTEALGRPIDIQTVALSIWGGLGVELGEVTIANPVEMQAAASGHLLSADYIDAKLALLPLLSGEYRIDRFIINEPVISLYKAPSGQNNYTFPAMEEKAPAEVREKATPEAKAAAAAVSFERLEINDGQLTFIDDSSNTRLSIRELALRTALQNPRSNFYISSGKLTLGELTVVTDDTLPRVGFAVGYEVEYDYAQKQAVLKSGNLQINGLRFDLDGSLSHDGAGIRSTVSIQSGEVDVDQLFSLLPPEQRAKTEAVDIDGRFSLDTDIDYDASRGDDALIYNGVVQLVDLSMKMQDIPGELRFSRALLDFKPNNVRMNIEDGSFDGSPLTGHIVAENFDSLIVNGELAGKFNLAYLEPFLPAEGNHMIAGMSEFDLKFSGPVQQYEELDFSGTVLLQNGRYAADAIPFPLDSMSMDIYFDRRLTKVNTFSAYANSGHVNFSGRINDLVPYILADSGAAVEVSPAMDGRLTGQLDLSVANAFLPPKGNPEMDGDLSIDLALTGSLDRLSDLKPRGKVVVADGSYRDDLLPEPVTQLDAELRLSPDTITVERLVVSFESSDVSMNGNLIDPFPYLLPLESVDRDRVKKPLFLFTLSSQRFNVDRLFPEAVPGAGGEQEATTSADSISTFIFPDIDGRGSFAVDTLIYSKVEFTNVSGKVEVHNKKIDVYDTEGKAYTGDVSGRTSIDLADYQNPQYIGEFSGTQLQANDFISRFTRFGGHLFGEANMSGTYNATGWGAEQFLQSLSVDGQANIREGELVTSGAVYQGLNKIAKLVGDDLKPEQALKSFATDVYVEDGKVGFDELKMTLGTIGDFTVDGFYTFDGQLSYTGKVKLSKEYTNKIFSGGLLGEVGGLLGGGNVDRVTLPLTIDGTIDQPNVGLDVTGVADDLQKGAGEEARDLLQGLLKKKDD